MSEREEMRQEMIAKIQKKSHPAQLRLMGMFKHNEEANKEDEVYEETTNGLIYKNSQESKVFQRTALDILHGKKAFDASLIPNISEYFTEEEMKSEEFTGETALSETRDFWLSLLQKAPFVASTITEKDAEVLKSLSNIEVFLEEKVSDYRVEFTFRTNEYFTNEKLCIEVLVDGDEAIEEVKSTKIDWKANKNVTEELTEKKQKNKKTGQVRTVKEMQKQESFFWIFGNYVAPEDDEDYDEEVEEDDEFFFSDDNLFYQSQRVVEFFRNSFFTFFIPAAFGLEVKEFMDDNFDLEGENDEEVKENVKNQLTSNLANKPECKQQ